MESWLVIGKGRTGRSYATYIRAYDVEQAQWVGGYNIMSALNRDHIRLPELSIVRAVREVKKNGLLEEYKVRFIVDSAGKIKRWYKGRCGPFYGHRHSEENLKKITANYKYHVSKTSFKPGHMGKANFKKGHVPWNKGKIYNGRKRKWEVKTNTNSA